VSAARVGDDAGHGTADNRGSLIMPVTEPVNSPSVEELTVYPFNRMELRMAQSGLRGRSAAERAAISEMVRTRGAAYATRFRHAAELSWRMPEMYWSALDDGRMTLEHMDAIWRRMDRHAGLQAAIADREAELQRQRDLAGGDEDDDGKRCDDGDAATFGGFRRVDDQDTQDAQAAPVPWDVDDAPWRARFPDVESDYCPSADRAVERAVTDWLMACPHRLITTSGAGSLIPRSTVTIHRLRDIVDTAVDEDLAYQEAYAQQRRIVGVEVPVDEF
jgi:hypothetical protein